MNKFQKEILATITDPNALAIIQALQNELAEKEAEIAHLNRMADKELANAQDEAYAMAWQKDPVEFQRWLDNVEFGNEEEELTEEEEKEQELAAIKELIAEWEGAEIDLIHQGDIEAAQEVRSELTEKERNLVDELTRKLQI